MKVLIVDDEPLVRKSLARACQLRGHEVTEAEDGIKGLELWLRDAPDVVFVDVLMPGLSGPELILEVRKRMNFTSAEGEVEDAGYRQATERGQNPNGKSDRRRMGYVILMSAYSGKHNIEAEKQVGVDLFIPKPFNDIFEVVKRAEELANANHRREV